jgi:hypothetical protein
MKHRLQSLSSVLEQNLNMYALAAGAAGVGILALGQSSEAKIVYTHANTQINVDGGMVPLDLNHDGIVDFNFDDVFSVQRAGRAQSDAYSFSYFTVAPAQSPNLVYAVQSNNRWCAAAVPKGVKVGPHSPFEPDASVMAFASNGGAASCPWRPVMQAYLGLKFSIKGKTHYGWARVKRVNSKYGTGFPAIITGYAYETISNRQIVTGKTKGADVVTVQPGGLGHLAAGAAAWRKAGGER